MGTPKLVPINRFRHSDGPTGSVMEASAQYETTTVSAPPVPITKAVHEFIDDHDPSATPD